ncbi:hypothetical protein KC341_g75 [Hortaea werneckii]|nr:hypothetical protein KC341_g75 [Hortaea werneckii]
MSFVSLLARSGVDGIIDWFRLWHRGRSCLNLLLRLCRFLWSGRYCGTGGMSGGGTTGPGATSRGTTLPSTKICRSSRTFVSTAIEAAVVS